MATLGERIRSLRIEKEMSQEEIANMFGLKNRSTVSNWEAGRISPDHEIIVKLSQLFNVSTDYMLGVSDKRNQNEFIEIALKDGTVLNSYMELFDGLEPEDFEKVVKIIQGFKAKTEAEKELNI
jgi:transcriptional regulator with XRE-family HTH domain